MSEVRVNNLSNESLSGGPTISGITTFSSPYLFTPPVGDSASRPSSCPSGSLRFNTDTAHLEYYRGDTIGWVEIEATNDELGGGTSSSNAGLGARGIIGGCQTPDNNPATELRFITISTFGADQDFGDLSASRQFSIGLASRTRGISLGGRTSNSPFGSLNVIEFVTFSTLGDATDFGDSQMAQRGAGASSQTRGVYTLGNISPYNIINYVTIASTGDSNDFGDLSNTHRNIDGCGCSSSTRGIFAGAYVNSNANIIEYITIATTGNTTDFGDLTDTRRRAMSVSSPTRAVILGGGSPGNVGDRTTMNSIEFATTGDGVDFGTLSVNYEAGSNFSNGHGGL